MEWVGGFCYWWWGLTQPSTQHLKASGVSVDNALGGVAFQMWMAEWKKGVLEVQVCGISSFPCFC